LRDRLRTIRFAVAAKNADRGGKALSGPNG
jgi:hypothetical protein